MGLGSLTMAQCASQVWQFYWEWLCQDADVAGDGSGGDGEGEEDDNHEQGKDEGFHHGGADEDYVDGE